MSEEREQHKEMNAAAIKKAIDALLQAPDLQPNTRYSFPLPELFINGQRIPGAELAFIYQGFDTSKGNGVLTIEKNGVQLALRDFTIGEYSFGDDERLSMVTDGIVSHEKAEGNGLAGALMSKTNELIPKMLELLAVPPGQNALCIVVDRAKGHEKQRTGWTSRQMEALGFKRDAQLISELQEQFDLYIEPEELPNTFFKFYEAE